MKKNLSSFMLLAMILVSCEGGHPVIHLEDGFIAGVNTEIDGVFAFKGIPYAAPPLDSLRWKAPQPVKPWEGTLDCFEFGHPPYQSVHLPGGYATEWGYGEESPYSEDCLYLNVWTRLSGEKQPVAVWIHGGGYREGWGSEPEFDGQEWANKGVVLVTINYRLGVFGFLTHPELCAENEQGVSGNYGILDQIEALKWVKRNIEKFGGDPDNVTIFGQSAGGGSVRTLCESPLARGLFHKAVIMSAGGLVTEGSTATPKHFRQVSMEEAGQMTKKILDWAGIDNLEKMRKAPTEVLHTLNNIYASVTKDRDTWMPIYPLIDGYVCKQSFDDAAKNGALANVPYMIGYTMNDLGNMGGGIAEFCFNRDSIGSNAWAYQFARPLPDDGSHPEVTARLKGAFHSSDLWYVFKSLQHCWRPWVQGDWDLSERMLTAWTNFAKYSNPNGAENNDGPWTKCTRKSPTFMIFKLDESDKENSAMGTPLTAE